MTGKVLRRRSLCKIWNRDKNKERNHLNNLWLRIWNRRWGSWVKNWLDKIWRQMNRAKIYKIIKIKKMKKCKKMTLAMIKRLFRRWLIITWVLSKSSRWYSIKWISNLSGYQKRKKLKMSRSARSFTLIKKNTTKLKPIRKSTKSSINRLKRWGLNWNKDMITIR